MSYQADHLLQSILNPSITTAFTILNDIGFTTIVDYYFALKQAKSLGLIGLFFGIIGMVYNFFY